MNRPAAAKSKQATANKSRGTPTSKAPRAARSGGKAKPNGHETTVTKQLWPVRVPAIDSDLARDENRRIAENTEERGWQPLITDFRRPNLQVNVEPLCREFPGLHTGRLPRGMKHFYDEPAVAHLTQHMCWQGKPTEQICAAARALFVLGQTGRALRPGGWQQHVRQELVRSRSHEQRQERSYVALSEWVRESMRKGPGDHLLRSSVIAFLEDKAASAQSGRLGFEELLQQLQAPPALVGARAKDRPWLVLAEGELLRDELFSPKDVGRLIVDQRNKSHPTRQVQGRIPLLRWELALTIFR